MDRARGTQKQSVTLANRSLMPFPFDPSPALLRTVVNGEKLASCEVAFVPIWGAGKDGAAVRTPAEEALRASELKL